MQYWVIPPKANGEFVACMENVLETYAEPDDRRFPVLNMDEQPVELLREVRVEMAATKAHARRVDDKDERAGTASIFLFTEALSGWRKVRVREPRTQVGVQAGSAQAGGCYAIHHHVQSQNRLSQSYSLLTRRSAKTGETR